jgi:hypothetical protein
MTRMLFTRRIAGALGVATTLALATILQASTPGSGTINTPSDDALGTKQTLSFTAGPFAGGSLAGFQVKDTVAICTQAVTPPGVCDVFTVNLNLPAGYWATRRGNLTASIKWADAPDGNDMDLYIVDEEGKIVGSSTTDNTVEASETAVFPNPGTGGRTYRVVVVNWLSPVPIASAAGSVSFNLTPYTSITLPPGPTAPAYAPRFHNFYPPSGLGEHAGEPSLGVNHKTGGVMYIAWLETLRATFSDSTSPAGSNWANRSFLATNTRSNDPILFTDPATGRTFVSQLIFPSKQSLSAFTNTDGDTWEISQGSGINAGVDHQTIGGGRFPANLTSIALDGYPNAVYYAAQDLVTAEFAISVDGGRTYGPAIPMYATDNCAGIHGHIKVSPVDGTAYVPVPSCAAGEVNDGDGQQAVAVTKDGGLTWNLVRVPGTKASSWDPAVGVGSNGTVYFGYGDNGDRTPRVSVWNGTTWTASGDLGQAWGIKRIAFPAMVAGDDKRAAFAFLGTRHEGEALGSGAGFEGTWALYVSTTYDGGATWVTVNASGDDPVQRGNICDAGLGCPGSPDTRNLLDFMDVQMDAAGRILVGYADGCVSPGCIAGVDKNDDGFVDGLDNDAADRAVIARQSGGLGLLSAFDPPVPSAPAPPQLTASLQGTGAALAWSTPDDGGAAITGYRVYRNGVLAASVGADVNTFKDALSTPTTKYRVSALNPLGEGAQSPEVVATVPPTSCVAPGILVANDTLDNAPNVPALPAGDVKTLHVSEPYGTNGTGMLHFTIATGGGALPPNSQWFVIWNRTVPDATHDRNYVAMKTDLLGNASFEYGRVNYPIVAGNTAPNQGNIPTRFGSTTGSYDAGTGVLKIQVPTASVDNVGAGAMLLSMEVRTFIGRGDVPQISQAATSDYSPAGSYLLVGNASCLAPPDAPSNLAATSKKGIVQLAWTDNSGDETGFLIERSTSATDGFVQIVEVPANTAAFADAGVAKRATYFYRVRAAKGAARSAYSNVASVRVK